MGQHAPGIFAVAPSEKIMCTTPGFKSSGIHEAVLGARDKNARTQGSVAQWELVSLAAKFWLRFVFCDLEFKI